MAPERPGTRPEARRGVQLGTRPEARRGVQLETQLETRRCVQLETRPEARRGIRLGIASAGAWRSGWAAASGERFLDRPTSV